MIEMGLIGDYGRVRATLHEAERRERRAAAEREEAEHPREPEPERAPATYQPAQTARDLHPEADAAAKQMRRRLGLG